MSTEILTGEQVTDAGLAGWANLHGVLRTRLRTKDFATGLAIVDEIGAAAEEANHHPDLDLRYTRVDVTLSSHDVGGLTRRDVDLARRVTEIAAAHGARLDPAVSRVELGLDTPDQGRIAPFWEAVLGRTASDDELADPDGDGPLVWFQSSGSQEPRQRWHPDVWVDPERVPSLVAAATAAGGELVDESAAPRFWVLADPEGNRVCLCTWQTR
jgi:4a-hydroxytetrahydrobiopterin dehydratase